MPLFPHKLRNYQWWALAVVMIVAFVFRFQHIGSIPPEIHSAQAALIGTLTVMGVFFLARELFNWEIAAFSSFFLAVSLWHVIFSRFDLQTVAGPFFFVWGVYYLWKAKRSVKAWDFAMSGFMLGLGCYTGASYCLLPLAVLLAIWAYWRGIKSAPGIGGSAFGGKDYSHEKYLHIRNLMTRGFALTMLVALLVAFPIGLNYYLHPTGSALIHVKSLDSFLTSAGVTLGMFNISGDASWFNNIAGRPEVFWPIGVFFVIGFIRSLIKLFRHKQKHGHHPTVQVFLLSWFILGLLPAIFSGLDLPNALTTFLVVPVVMIFAGEGLWFMYDFSRKWYYIHDNDDVVVHQHHAPESRVIAGLAVILLLGTIMMTEYHAYFVDWAQNPHVSKTR